MGRNFPSFRNLVEDIERDLKRVKRLIKDESLALALDEIVDFLNEEAGAISVSRNPILISLLLLIARVIAHDGRDHR